MGGQSAPKVYNTVFTSLIETISNNTEKLK